MQNDIAMASALPIHHLWCTADKLPGSKQSSRWEADLIDESENSPTANHHTHTHTHTHSPPPPLNTIREGLTPTLLLVGGGGWCLHTDKRRKNTQFVSTWSGASLCISTWGGKSAGQSHAAQLRYESTGPDLTCSSSAELHFTGRKTNGDETERVFLSYCERARSTEAFKSKSWLIFSLKKKVVITWDSVIISCHEQMDVSEVQMFQMFVVVFIFSFSCPTATFQWSGCQSWRS